MCCNSEKDIGRAQHVARREVLSRMPHGFDISGPAGAVVLWHGLLLHTMGPNWRCDHPRPALWVLSRHKRYFPVVLIRASSAAGKYVRRCFAISCTQRAAMARRTAEWLQLSERVCGSGGRPRSAAFPRLQMPRRFRRGSRRLASPGMASPARRPPSQGYETRAIFATLTHCIRMQNYKKARDPTPACGFRGD